MPAFLVFPCPFAFDLSKNVAYGASGIRTVGRRKKRHAAVPVGTTSASHYSE
jgi:hypothetical protein